MRERTGVGVGLANSANSAVGVNRAFLTDVAAGQFDQACALEHVSDFCSPTNFDSSDQASARTCLEQLIKPTGYADEQSWACQKPNAFFASTVREFGGRWWMIIYNFSSPG